MSNVITLSIETHLFFARIMKEHSLFLQAGFPGKDKAWSERAGWFREQFEELLRDVVNLAECRASDCVLESGELTTRFTLPAEQRTSQLTGVPIDSRITRLEQQLRSGCFQENDLAFDRGIRQTIRQLNARALRLVSGLIEFKESILREVSRCRLYTANYPLLLRHIIREARLYRATLESLMQNRPIQRPEFRDTEDFWNQIMMEHALFIRGLLDPTEETLIDTADEFAGEFKELLEQAVCQENQARQRGQRQPGWQNRPTQPIAPDCLTAEELRSLSLEETRKLRDFKTSGAEGILNCQIASIILPLLADHVLREANHYIRILECDQG